LSNVSNESYVSNVSNDTDQFNCKLSELSGDNVTNSSFWQIGQERLAGAIVVGVLVVIFFLVATIWNLFIIITFFIKYKLLKQPAHILLFNMALTNLLICLTTMMFIFVTAFGQEFIFGSSDVIRCTMCNVAGFCLMFLVLVSLHMLAALSVDRFILLSRPLRYKRWMNQCRAAFICIVIYTLAFLLAILPIVGFGEYEFNQRFASCVPQFTPMSNLYYVVFVAVEALIPISILMLTNVFTYRIVNKFVKRKVCCPTYRRRDRPEERNNESHQHHQQQKQKVKMFGALFIAVIVTYAPTIITIFVFLILTSFFSLEDEVPSVVYIIGFVCFLTNSVFQPIIESFFDKELRYQVNHTKTGVRRVSTIITTQVFSNKALEEAAQKVDDENAPRPQRLIRFLDGRKVVLPPKQDKQSSVTDLETVETEISVNSLRSATTKSRAPHLVSSSSLAASCDDAVIGNNGSENCVRQGKTRLSVTFHEQDDIIMSTTHAAMKVSGSRGGSADAPSNVGRISVDADIHEPFTRI